MKDVQMDDQSLIDAVNLVIREMHNYWKTLDGIEKEEKREEFLLLNRLLSEFLLEIIVANK